MGEMHAALRASILEGIPAEVPEPVLLDSSVDHAPDRPVTLSAKQRRLALENALRYLPSSHHEAVSYTHLTLPTTPYV